MIADDRTVLERVRRAVEWVEHLPTRIRSLQTSRDLYDLLDEGERLGFARVHVQDAIDRSRAEG